jgi:hypothetical protein
MAKQTSRAIEAASPAPRLEIDEPPGQANAARDFLIRAGLPVDETLLCAVTLAWREPLATRTQAPTWAERLAALAKGFGPDEWLVQAVKVVDAHRQPGEPTFAPLLPIIRQELAAGRSNAAIQEFLSAVGRRADAIQPTQ